MNSRKVGFEGAEGAEGAVISWMRPSSLLFIYSVIPMVAVFLTLDWFFFDLKLSRSLPADPHDMQWFNMFFMLPHIFASLFTFFDAEYVAYYGVQLARSVVVILAIIISVFTLRAFAPFMLIISIYTVYHLVSQQTGIAAMLARNATPMYKIWKWVTFFALTIVYLAAIIGDQRLKVFLTGILPWFYVLYSLLAYFTAKKVLDKIGFYYTCANSVMIIFSCVLYAYNFSFFMIFIPRFVHDVTAFFFYISHNANRNSAGSKNMISRLGVRLGLPEYFYTPAVGILCTVIVTLFFKKYMIVLLSFMALFHYYWEGRMWKRGTPHRRYIHIGMPRV
ncbi:MAG: hypothetical protein PSX71_13490 [bacterium]|nr:hypothetical protein [bacterium]